MVTTGRLSRVPPIEPKNGAPKAKTPPSDAASHVPAPVAVGPGGPVMGAGGVAATAGHGATAAGSAAARAASTVSQRRSRLTPIVVSHTLRVALTRQKRAG